MNHHQSARHNHHQYLQVTPKRTDIIIHARCPSLCCDGDFLHDPEELWTSCSAQWLSLNNIPLLAQPMKGRDVKTWNFRKANWVDFTKQVNKAASGLPHPCYNNLDNAYDSYCKMLQRRASLLVYAKPMQGRRMWKLTSIPCRSIDQLWEGQSSWQSILQVKWEMSTMMDRDCGYSRIWEGNPRPEDWRGIMHIQHPFQVCKTSRWEGNWLAPFLPLCMPPVLQTGSMLQATRSFIVQRWSSCQSQTIKATTPRDTSQPRCCVFHTSSLNASSWHDSPQWSTPNSQKNKLASKAWSQ